MRMTFIDSDPPTFRVELDGHSFVAGKEDFLTPLAFSKRFLIETNRMPPKIDNFEVVIAHAVNLAVSQWEA